MIWENAKHSLPPSGKMCLIYTGHNETVLASWGWFGGWTIYGLPLRERLRFRFFGQIKTCGIMQRINILWWCLIVPPEGAGQAWGKTKGDGLGSVREKPDTKPLPLH